MRHFWTFLDNGDIHYHGLVEVSPNGYVNDTPIEDYGDYLLWDDFLEPQEAFRIWLKIQPVESE